MSRSLKIFTQPAAEPLSLAEAKTHLGLPNETLPDDTYISALITAARRHCENVLGRALITQTWDLCLDGFPADDGRIELARPPLQSVTWLKYKSAAGILTTMDAAQYIVDCNCEAGRIALAYGKSWPAVYDEIQAVQIRFVCGYGNAAAVPEIAKQAIRLKLASLYVNRGDLAFDDTVDRAIDALTDGERVYSV
jgi:uncharacterized phiE125 gp8 family phage protein